MSKRTYLALHHSQPVSLEAPAGQTVSLILFCQSASLVAIVVDGTSWPATLPGGASWPASLLGVSGRPASLVGIAGRPASLIGVAGRPASLLGFTGWPASLFGSISGGGIQAPTLPGGAGRPACLLGVADAGQPASYLGGASRPVFFLGAASFPNSILIGHCPQPVSSASLGRQTVFSSAALGSQSVSLASVPIGPSTSPVVPTGLLTSAEGKTCHFQGK